MLTILIFNVTFGAAWSVLVLYARERLGLGAIGFGLITTVGALGGLAGTLSYGWITRRVSLANLMRIGLIIETLHAPVPRPDHHARGSRWSSSSCSARTRSSGAPPR